MSRPIPLILDTDIGTDIDDTWALAVLLRSPEVDVRLALSATGDTAYRARLLAKFLQVAGREDIPVGVGLPTVDESTPRRLQEAWVQGYTLADYPGTVYADGVTALIETIRHAPEPVTLLSIGPLTNLAAALERDPAIARNVHFVGMHGSVYRGYGGAPEPHPEYNVRLDIPASRRVFSADWLSLTLTPLDTCGLVTLKGEAFAAVRHSRHPITRALMENYSVWCAASPDWLKTPLDPARESSTLFDVVAVYLAFADDLLDMQTLPLIVDEAGFTRVHPAGKPARCAMAWKNQPAFEQWMVERLR
ncbi:MULTISPECIES: nucleoside hydrolase [Anaerolinea]|uniref:nucleoside hydrolase n=1 Tax=Anaerolinea TaxID=233189 RepID=UPI00260E9F07|nr:nucleoside hydrolase [Anaerolinea thermophila]